MNVIIDVMCASTSAHAKETIGNENKTQKRLHLGGNCLGVTGEGDCSFGSHSLPVFLKANKQTFHVHFFHNGK